MREGRCTRSPVSEGRLLEAGYGHIQGNLAGRPSKECGFFSRCSERPAEGIRDGYGMP